MVVYKYTNKLSGKMYIGITERDLKVRRYEHEFREIDNGTPFHNALKKHGIDNFEVEIIDSAKSIEELKEKEKHWIKELKTNVREEDSKGYNLTLGGDGVLGLKGCRAPWYGKSRSPGTRRKISEARKGRFGGEFHWLHNNGHLISGEKNPNFGKPLSEEQKMAQSMKMKRRYAGASNPRAKPVTCLTTGEEFQFIKAASEKYNINKADISACCKGKLKSAGKHPVTREKMAWEYRRMEGDEA